MNFDDMLLAAFIGYLIGSIPFGLLLTKAAGLGDVRTIGSGNIGATNVLRTGNKPLALATLLLDVFKALIPITIASSISPDLAAPVGFGAFFGHLYPVWLQFKGGKGVATFFGVMFGLSWPIGLMTAGTWVLTAVLFSYSSLAGLTTALLAPVYFYLLVDAQTAGFAVLLTMLIFLKHRENIQRLLSGTESKIGGA